MEGVPILFEEVARAVRHLLGTVSVVTLEGDPALQNPGGQIAGSRVIRVAHHRLHKMRESEEGSGVEISLLALTHLVDRPLAARVERIETRPKVCVGATLA